MKPIFRHWATAAVIALAALAIQAQSCAKSPSYGSNAAATPCAPTNYTKITNNGPLPADFCAFTYLPWRVRLPDNPQMRDATNTHRLQTLYLPNSGLGNGLVQGLNVIQTLGVLENVGPNVNEGNGNHILYHGTPSDPLIHIVCAGSRYGCGDMDGNPTTAPFPDVHIPAHARSSGNECADCDKNLAVVSDDGTYIEMFGCRIPGDLVSGQTLSPATCNMGGASYGHIVTSKGNNDGNINAGDGQPALVAMFHEVMAGNIQHAIHAWGGCFTGGRWPGTYAGECADGNGIPVGSHLWLDLTRDQIDALSAQDPTLIPPHMKVFAYAAHEHGIFALDTGNGNKYISQPIIEDAKPCLTSGACTRSFWWDWIINNGGAFTSDKNLKLLTPIDFSRLASHMFVLDNCYVRGTCPDSVPESAPPVEPPPPPVAHWPFNEGSGTTAHTTPPPDRPLTLTVPGPVFGAGKTGTSLECNDSGYAALGTFFPGTLYSWSVWFQPTAAPSTSAIQQPLNAGGVQGDSWGFSWGHVNPSFRQSAQHRLSDGAGGAGTWVSAQLPETLPLGQWAHLAATYDGANLRFYLNGQAVATTAAPTSAPPTGNFSVCRPAPAALATAAPGTSDKGLWGRVTPIADNAHPNLFWNQAEINQMRTQLLVNHSPAWLWDRYVTYYQGVTAIPPNPNDPNQYEPWRTNTRAALTYMLEPTQAKADAIRASLLSFPVVWPCPPYPPSWHQSTGWGFSGFPTALMYDLLMAYHPNTLSAAEVAQMKAWFKLVGVSSGAGHFQDEAQFGYPFTREGRTIGEYVNWWTNDLWNGFPLALVSGDQALVDYWADSGWPHDRFTYDGTNPPPPETNRFDLVMNILAIFDSGASGDAYMRENFRIGGDPTGWKTICYRCEDDPTGNTKMDGGSYHPFMFNSIVTSAVMAYHNGMTGVFSGTPGRLILGLYLLNVNSRTHTDYRSTSLTRHPDLYTWTSNYVAMRYFSDNPTLQAGLSDWHETNSNTASTADPLVWPFLGYPFGVAPVVPPPPESPPDTTPVGRLDDLKIWTTALTPSQILAEYAQHGPAHP